MSDYTELANRLRKRGERINKFGSPFFTEANANDMIAAADAIEELEKKMLNWQATADDHWDAYQHWFHKYMDDMPRWIPVTERLPKKHEWCLVYVRGAKIPTMAYINNGGDWYDNFSVRKVSYWMPLPKLPKEG